MLIASRISSYIKMLWSFPGSSAGKQSACNAGNPGLIPGWGRSPGEGIGYSLQYSWASWCLRWQRICWQCGRPGFDPWVGKIPSKRAWQPSLVFLSAVSSQRGAWKAAVSGVAKCGLGLSTHSVGYCGPGSAI